MNEHYIEKILIDEQLAKRQDIEQVRIIYCKTAINVIAIIINENNMNTTFDMLFLPLNLFMNITNIDLI